MLVSVPIHPKGNPKTIEDDKIDEKEYENIYGDRHHVRSFGLDYVERLIKAGFQLIHDVKVKNINPNEIEYFWFK